MTEEKKKKEKGRGGRTAAAAALLLLLAGGGYASGGFGLLPNDGDSLKPQTEQVETAAPAETPVQTEDDGVLTVRVQEHQIFFEGEPVTPEELEEALLRGYEEGMRVELIDDGAIKAEYDAAAAVLARLNIPYETAG